MATPPRHERRRQAQPLGRLEGKQVVDLAGADARRDHRLADADVAADAAAALAHAAGLAQLDVEAAEHRRVGDDGGGHDHALAADADDHDVVDGAAGVVGARGAGSCGLRRTGLLLCGAHASPAFVVAWVR